MNIFKNKFLIKLIATLCLFLALISFGAPTTVQAAKDDDGWGGVLISPVVKLLTALGDGVMELLHSSVQSQGIALIKIDGSTTWENILGTLLGIAVGILAAAAFIVAVVATGGAAAYIATFLGATAATVTTITIPIVVASATIGVFAGRAVYEGMVPEDIYLPAFSMTAERIFSNEIPLFDINFFQPMDPQEIEEAVADGYSETLMIQYGQGGNIIDEDWEDGTDDLENLIETEKNPIGDDETTGKYYRLKQQLSDKYADEDNFYSIQDIIDGFNGNSYKDTIVPLLNEILNKTDNALVAKGVKKMDRNHTGVRIKRSSDTDQDGNEIDSVMIDITVPNAEVFDGPEDWTRVRILFAKTISTSTITTQVHSTAEQLQGVISTWYFILLNLSLLILMVVLIYSGIRIVLSSTAGEKAKYKERIIDWLVAMCLLFVMHYIMVFAVEIVDRITDLVRSEAGTNGNFTTFEKLTDTQNDNAKKLFESKEGKKLIDEGIAKYDDVNKKLIWTSDLTGLFRVQSQLTDEGTSNWVGYSFAYVVLVAFTLFFAWTYLKRIVYMAFLTMIAPLVAMTYPIDKITDGKAQAFNSWLKEYIFNLMIQPMHLLLYSILVSAAFELVSKSAIYALVALGFMMPAEKLMRKFFGFEKASTPGLLGGAAGAALAMTGINKLLGHRPRGGSSGGKSSGGNESKDSAKINFKSKDAVSGMKGIAGEPPEDVQVQDSDESNIRTNESETERESNSRRGGPGNRDNPNPAERNNSMIDDDGMSEQDLYSMYMGENQSRNSSMVDDDGMSDQDLYSMYMSGNKPEKKPENKPADTKPEKKDNESTKQEIPKLKTKEQSPKERNQDEWYKFNQERNKNLKDKWKDNRKERKQEKKQERKDNFNGFLSRHPGAKDAYETMKWGVEDFAYNHPHAASHIKGTMASTGAYYRALGKRIGDKIQNGHPIKAMAKGAAGLAGAATFGAAGLAMGVVSGDAGKAFQYASAGALGGHKLASSTVGALQKATAVDEDYLKEQYELEAYGNEYKKYKLEEEKKKMQESEKYINYLQKTMSVSRDEAQGILKTTGDRCFDAGITNVEDIATIHKMTQGEDGLSINEAIGAKKFNDLLPSDVSKMSQKKRNEYIDTWKKDYKDAGYGADAEKWAQKSMDYAIKFADTQSSLKKSQV